MRPLFIFLSLILLTFTLAHAQESTPEPADGWTIEQRCVGEPTPRPESWTFEGTILMMGYAGIHGVRDEWETPRVVVSLDMAGYDDHGDLSGGALSPDGHWYASPYGTVSRDARTYNVITNLDEIRVHSTLNDSQYAWVQEAYNPAFQGSFYRIFWIDNEHFLYRGLVINPFTGAQSDWQGLLLDYGYSNIAIPSPDWTLALQSSGTGQSLALYDMTTRDVINPLEQINRFGNAAWSPDSEFFVAPLDTTLARFNREGQMTNIIFSTRENIGISSVKASNTGRYFSFSVNSSATRLSSLHIADTETQVIYDTCRAFGSIAWLGDDTQFASSDSDTTFVLVMNMDTYTLHAVARHSGSVIGWRADD
jgi:hypothetical protein